jgi:hypothetical protein
MKVGLKLFDKNNKVVVEQVVYPGDGIGNTSMIIHKGVHYSYRGLMDDSLWRTAPYARFDECAPPYELL